MSVLTESVPSLAVMVNVTAAVVAVVSVPVVLPMRPVPVISPVPVSRLSQGGRRPSAL